MPILVNVYPFRWNTWIPKQLSVALKGLYYQTFMRGLGMLILANVYPLRCNAYITKRLCVLLECLCYKPISVPLKGLYYQTFTHCFVMLTLLTVHPLHWNTYIPQAYTLQCDSYTPNVRCIRMVISVKFNEILKPVLEHLNINEHKWNWQEFIFFKSWSFALKNILFIKIKEWDL